MREIYLSIAVLCAVLTTGTARAENWDRFRGPNGAGQGEGATIPSLWTDANYLWKRPLAGVGHSSPVVWDDCVFVTSGDPATGEIVVQAFDAVGGAPLWERRFPGSTYRMHAFNSYASSTPAVDAERLYVVWRDGTELTLLALTHDGEEAWRADAGECTEAHGFGTSPIVLDDVVYLENDNEASSEIVAFECGSGDVRWRTPRAAGTTSFSTPCVLDPRADRKLLLVASNASGLTAIDASTGRVAWQALENDLPQRCVASTVVAGGLIFVSCGQGGNGLHMIAVRPPVNGNDAQEAFRLTQGIPNVPTAVAADELLFLWHDGGTVSCVDLATGRPHWRERVGGNRHSSPVRVGNRIFGTSLDGEVFVLAADREFKLLATNSLGERTRATPAVVNDRIFLRTESSLVCVGEPTNNN